MKITYNNKKPIIISCIKTEYIGYVSNKLWTPLSTVKFDKQYQGKVQAKVEMEKGISIEVQILITDFYKPI